MTIATLCRWKQLTYHIIMKCEVPIVVKKLKTSI